jgi:hypothetical protein
MHGYPRAIVAGARKTRSGGRAKDPKAPCCAREQAYDATGLEFGVEF